MSHIELVDRKNLVMVEDGIIIGTSGFGKSRMALERLFPFTFCRIIFGKWYGRLLLQAVVGELKKMGFGKVFLWVLEENRNACYFYEKCGFNNLYEAAKRVQNERKI